MPQDLAPVFARLRALLQAQKGWKVITDSPTEYSIAGEVGPAALKAWRDEKRFPVVLLGSAKTGKACVSYHLMGVYGNPKLVSTLSPALKKRMQGKSCFNFVSTGESLLEELADLTTRSIEGMKRGGFVLGG